MMKQANGRPVRWDPCRPIHYVVSRQVDLAGSDALLTDALARVSATTGLRFVRDPDTAEEPSADRAVVQRQRYGNRYAPVLIAWSSADRNPGLAADVAGYAGPVALRPRVHDDLVYVSGQVVLDAPQLETIRMGGGGPARARAIVLHELGHLVGIDHVQDPRALMYPSNSGSVVDFSDGDLRGLAAVSGGACG